MMSNTPGRLAMAMQPATMRRALGYAVVVGAILLAINHGDAILRNDLSVERVVRMAFTVFVPYVVSTCSSVGAMRAAAPGQRSFARRSSLNPEE